MSDFEDYYDILGISPKATSDEIEKAWIELCWILSDVRLIGAPEAAKQRAEKELKKVNNAHDILKDPQKRHNYDQQWHQIKDKPKPVVDPQTVHFDNVNPNDIKTGSFIIRNLGGPYNRINISNPNTWVKVVRWHSLTDIDELPLQVEIEAAGEDFGNNYSEQIKVNLDDEETYVRIELQTQPQYSTKSGTSPSTQAPSSSSGTPVGSPPTSGSGRKTKRGKGLLVSACILSVIIIVVGIVFLKSNPPKGPISLSSGFSTVSKTQSSLTSSAPNIHSLTSTTPMLAAGSNWTVGLKSDGTVVAVGDNTYGQCNVGSWTSIAQVATGEFGTIGLKSNGTVVATGNNTFGECNVGTWTDIIQVAAGANWTVGLKSDGTVVATGNNANGQCNVNSWAGIIQVAAGSNWTIGLKSNGAVVAVGDNGSDQCNVSSWINITHVVAGGYFFTVGLKSNGTVVTVGQSGSGEANVSSWTNINQIAAGFDFTLGLKPNGTVVTTGSANLSSWTGIVQIASRDGFIVGLKSDGTVVATGNNANGQCNVSSWNLHLQ